MVRPEKIGLDYFPLDVDIFDDEKIEAIAGEFGSKGEIVVVKLLCAIYKKGYFVQWSDLTQAQLLKRLPDITDELLKKIVNRLVKWEFFDKDLFDSENVLTSLHIQANFFEATKRRKTPRPTQYIINVNNNSVNVNNNHATTGVNVNISTQSKVKKSKVNKSKEKEEEPLKTNSLFSNYFDLFTSLSKKNLSKRAMATQEFLKLPSFDQNFAVTGARNYLTWYLKSNPDDVDGTYSINAYQFIKEMEFKNYQTIPEIKKKKTGYDSAREKVIPVPEWSNPDYAEEATDEEVAEFKRQLEALGDKNESK
ncbi:phage replisome organizer protein [Lactovum miscens]|uniref:Lin1244/Lin1753-like N-terminal domain-containing protein n=1 Tax=Lactovum miscens TaxID=190387 RepID=A0A841C1D8_9LACT|nr:phage replisome organiser protein [Lactovum miscens]MBB5887726.1 hypothetical protein [Lactovum miscens]